MKSCTGIVLCLSLMAAWFCHAADDRHVVLITIDGFPARMFWDAKTPIPRIRQLAADGVTAEGLRVSNPAMTWPNHTTLVTGVRAARHSVLYNDMLLRDGPGLPVKVEPKRDQAQLVAVPTIYDVLHRAGLRTAAVNWLKAVPSLQSGGCWPGGNIHDTVRSKPTRRLYATKETESKWQRTRLKAD